MKRKRPTKRTGRRGNPTKVGKVLGQIADGTDLGRHLEFAQIWERWSDIAGKHLSQHGQPRGVRDNVLHVEAASPVWMHKFAYKKWDIIRRINYMAGHELVSDLFIALADEEEERPESPKTGPDPNEIAD